MEDATRQKTVNKGSLRQLYALCTYHGPGLHFVPPPASSRRLHQRCKKDSEVDGQANAGVADACDPNEEAPHVHLEPWAAPLQ